MTFTLTDEDVRALGDGDVVVRDGLVGAEAARALAEEALALAAAARPAGIGRGGEPHHDRALRGDDILWLDDATAVGPALAAWREVIAAVAAELDRAAYLGIRSIELQLAIYRIPGAAYARHSDAFRGRALRRATLIHYLNPAWSPAHGGQLRAHTSAGPRTIEPILDRAILFLSDRVDHEVQPSHAPRLALTAWFRGPDLDL
ncbi:MAG TPA: 2OG-Fe(II) oxygenase [Kofleriaceae bacterium]|nr:2OG-Fe(II) oxygenase [Kofleriaceae bacterium]